MLHISHSILCYSLVDVFPQYLIIFYYSVINIDRKSDVILFGIYILVVVIFQKRHDYVFTNVLVFKALKLGQLDFLDFFWKLKLITSVN